ncbi:sigma-70 family RNA polymerase sigma factor [Paraglaciecola sp.]|uniref:sigma-70 family RNA polymerase sigma factor n=1 Tax=Paraglaciecola sp. TaxID=1920173 RepID=UPI0030F47463
MQATKIQRDHSLQSDEALMQQYAQGDFAAFEQLYQRHKGGLYRYFLRQLADKTLAEDLFQEIWSKVISHATQYQTTAKFSTWLYTLARHKLVDHVRHLKVVAKVIEETEQDNEHHTMSADTGQHNTPENLWEGSKAAEALKGCIEYLPRVQRECFLLKEEAGLSLDVIAQIVDANYEACKSRLRKAYESLRQCISRKIGGKLND